MRLSLIPYPSVAGDAVKALFGGAFDNGLVSVLRRETWAEPCHELGPMGPHRSEPFLVN